MTWRRVHCVQCWQTPDECTRCGCHDEPPPIPVMDPLFHIEKAEATPFPWPIERESHP